MGSMRDAGISVFAHCRAEALRSDTAEFAERGTVGHELHVYTNI